MRLSSPLRGHPEEDQLRQCMSSLLLLNLVIELIRLRRGHGLRGLVMRRFLSCPELINFFPLLIGRIIFRASLSYPS